MSLTNIKISQIFIGPKQISPLNNTAVVKNILAKETNKHKEFIIKESFIAVLNSFLILSLTIILLFVKNRKLFKKVLIRLYSMRISLLFFQNFVI